MSWLRLTPDIATLVGSAALAAGAAVALSVRGFPGRDGPPPPGTPPVARPAGRATIGLTVAVCLLAGFDALPLGLLAIPATGAWWLWRAQVARRRARRRQARVLESCAVLVSELVAGQPTGVALAEAARAWPALGPAAEAATLGGDVAASLRSLACARGAEDLALVAAAWQVSHHTGQGLAAALAVVQDDLTAARETRRVVSAELSSARATARLIAGLPVVALFMGRGAGGDPLEFLWQQPLGWACAAAGLLLMVAGLGWIEAIAGSVERTS